MAGARAAERLPGSGAEAFSSLMEALGDIAARLNPMPQGSTRIQGHLENLQPNTDYVSLIFQDGTCTTSGVVFAHFTSNSSGKAVYNEVVGQDIGTIRSIAVRLASDPLSNLACAVVE